MFFRKFVNKTIEFPDLSWILKNRENSGNYQTQKSGIFQVKNGQFFLQGTSGFGSTNSEDMVAYFLNQEKEEDKPVEQRKLTQEQDQALN